MALIAAIFGSVGGLFVGLLSMLLFGASLTTAGLLYFGVAVSTIAVASVAMLVRSNMRMALAVEAYETRLDDDWDILSREERESRLAAEDAFQRDLETPLSPDAERFSSLARSAQRRSG